jgi:ABC transporter substrate binding protein
LPALIAAVRTYAISKDYEGKPEGAHGLGEALADIQGDPVGTGLVASLARPDGNVTGLSIQATDLAAKRLELLREIVPGLRRLAIMANAGASPAVLEMAEVQATAHAFGLDVATLEIPPTLLARADEVIE